MKWIKKGLIYNVNGEYKWANNSVMTPTPIRLNEEIIRVYGGFRDSGGISRIGFIDVDSNNPNSVIKVSKKPVITLGVKGTFDDNGMILGDIVKRDNEIWMYYVGFQLINNIKFSAMTGLAISVDNGNSFERFSQAPLLDRTDNALFIRAVHSVLFDEGIWKIWYSVGSSWMSLNGNYYPEYHIRYTESMDGKSFVDNIGKSCLTPQGREYRIGRPRVYKLEDKYLMLFTSDDTDKNYKVGSAISSNGIKWARTMNYFNLQKSNSGWDSEMICYPTIVEGMKETYLFYSGNNMGQTGVGYAILKSN